MTNDQMRPGRFARWATARRKVSFVSQAIEQGAAVYLSTQLRHIKITDPAMVKANKGGFWVRRGNGWDCADGCAIRAVKP